LAAGAASADDGAQPAPAAERAAGPQVPLR
jgi:hypothetical protein